jgi:hypothetical protein
MKKTAIAMHKNMTDIIFVKTVLEKWNTISLFPALGVTLFSGSMTKSPVLEVHVVTFGGIVRVSYQ